MPYNNTPIAPPRETLGTVSLPLARVKKIISADEEVGSCSNNGAFVIALATEMFIQYLAEQTHTVVKTERKPRRNIQYRDVASAVARVDNLDFLADVVPKTMPYKKFKEQKAAKAAAEEAEASMLNGESSAAGSKTPVNGTNGTADSSSDARNGHEKGDDDEGDSDVMEVDRPEPSNPRGDDEAAVQLEMEMRGPKVNGAAEIGQSPAATTNGTHA
ncbi:uncharacterized protein BDZ99DRAFT_458318 [Mytilinidion resinicola]|uniref:Transcription factor CBF/NF-Y/archaeal histone domain-containing protein n=1 Tax=Mytilinidion resinicola TaxID=574789 RepID=A0A6A6Z5R4_9PEZI|nr:uncharacterized protein BDZ99DRAFT_458318 [Mytilinidion resinicola]KAF2816446.1 hypothetical protein BDZ99DRAFT_458318 [Mytilinidion resinicola]